MFFFISTYSYGFERIIPVGTSRLWSKKIKINKTLTNDRSVPVRPKESSVLGLARSIVAGLNARPQTCCSDHFFPFFFFFLPHTHTRRDQVTEGNIIPRWLQLSNTKRGHPLRTATGITGIVFDTQLWRIFGTVG